MGKHKIEVIQVTKINGEVFYHLILDGHFVSALLTEKEALESVERLKISISKAQEKVIFSEEIEI